MFVKIKEFFRHSRFVFSASCMMAMLMCSAFAVDGDAAASFDLSTTMTTSVQSIVTELLKMIAAVMPVTVTLLAAAIGITYGITFIKRIIKGSK